MDSAWVGQLIDGGGLALFAFVVWHQLQKLTAGLGELVSAFSRHSASVERRLENLEERAICRNYSPPTAWTPTSQIKDLASSRSTKR